MLKFIRIMKKNDLIKRDIFLILSFAVCFQLTAIFSFAQSKNEMVVVGEAELFQAGVISTEESEVKIAFSPDGNRCLWGTIAWDGGKGGWDIWESVRSNGIWSKPRNVSFNSDANDFDPAFAPDGKAVYFFSNREGGFGGDDIYYVSFDRKSGTYGAPQNSGANINSAGDEWGPSLSPDGKRLMFCTDGRGGSGKHDILVSKKTKKGWSVPENLGANLNSALDDFDATFMHDGKTIVFSSERKGKDNVDLYVSYRVKGKYTTPVMLVGAVNSAEGYEIGSAINLSEPGYLYFTTQNPQNGVGRSDIYRIKYNSLGDH